MASIKPTPPTATATLREELEYLYLRRQLVDDLILALEVYTLLGVCPRDRKEAVA